MKIKRFLNPPNVNSWMAGALAVVAVVTGRRRQADHLRILPWA
jgi:hypothetical protein